MTTSVERALALMKLPDAEMPPGLAAYRDHVERYHGTGTDLAFVHYAHVVEGLPLTYHAYEPSSRDREVLLQCVAAAQPSTPAVYPYPPGHGERWLPMSDYLRLGWKRDGSFCLSSHPTTGSVLVHLHFEAPDARHMYAYDLTTVPADASFLRRFMAANVRRSAGSFRMGVLNESALEWAALLAGEMGEFIGAIKNVKKGKTTIEAVAKEAGDILAYLVLNCARMGIDLEDAAASKFNEVSARVGSQERM